MKSESLHQLHKIEWLMEVVESVPGSCSPESATWFCSSIEDYLAGKGSIGDCLGLKNGKQGSPSIVRQYYLRKQTDALMEARTYCGCDGDKDWHVSGILAKEIENFSRFWNQEDLDKLDHAPDEWSQLTKCLFRAFRYSEKCTGKKFPRSQTRLHQIFIEYKNHMETLNVPMLSRLR